MRQQSDEVGSKSTRASAAGRVKHGNDASTVDSIVEKIIKRWASSKSADDLAMRLINLLRSNPLCFKSRHLKSLIKSGLEFEMEGVDCHFRLRQLLPLLINPAAFDEETLIEVMDNFSHPQYWAIAWPISVHWAKNPTCFTERVGEILKKKFIEGFKSGEFYQYGPEEKLVLYSAYGGVLAQYMYAMKERISRGDKTGLPFLNTSLYHVVRETVYDETNQYVKSVMDLEAEHAKYSPGSSFAIDAADTLRENMVGVMHSLRHCVFDIEKLRIKYENRSSSTGDSRFIKEDRKPARPAPKIETIAVEPKAVAMRRGNEPPLIKMDGLSGRIGDDGKIIAPEPARARPNSRKSTSGIGIESTGVQLLPEVLDTYIAQTGANVGPGRLTQGEKTDIWHTVNLLHADQIQIFVSQTMRPTESTRRTLSEINRRVGSDVVACKEFAGSDHLRQLLEQVAPGVKRIVIADQSSQSDILSLLETSPELLKDVRLLNMALPEHYTSMQSLEKTVYQAEVITIAILARLFEKDRTPMVESLLRTMLKGRLDVDEHGMNEFINNLDESSQPATDIAAIVARIKFFLGKTVSLVNELGRELILMKEFWTAA